jgi:hypothetical protein
MDFSLLDSWLDEEEEDSIMRLNLKIDLKFNVEYSMPINISDLGRNFFHSRTEDG